MTLEELVFVPSPGIGHLPPALNLAKLLLKRDPHLSILVLIMQMEPTSPTSLVEAYVANSKWCHNESSDQTRLKFLTLPSTLTTHHSPRALIDHQGPVIKRVIEERVRLDSIKLVGFVLDMFCATMVDHILSSDLINIPCYVLYTSGACFFSFTFRLLSDINDNKPLDSGDQSTVSFPEFKARYPVKFLPRHMPNDGLEWFLTLNQKYKLCKGIIVNTCTELESRAISYLHDSHSPPVYPVGPILELDNHQMTWSCSSIAIMEWLDDQPESSVVFLCFGSMGSFGGDQVKEIAMGLESSGFRFVWTLHGGGQVSLPDGFVGRTAHRGRIIDWAPQVAILGHRAVGGFVSHCGWNSVLESMWFGVPIAAWPMQVEQQSNAFQVVEELRIGVEIMMDYVWRKSLNKDNNIHNNNNNNNNNNNDHDNEVGFVVTAEEVEVGVRKLMSMEMEGVEIRERVKELSEKCRNALEDGGSSYHALGRFIADVHGWQ